MNKPLNILADGRLFHDWNDLDRYLNLRRLKITGTVKVEDNNYEVTIE